MGKKIKNEKVKCPMESHKAAKWGSRTQMSDSRCPPGPSCLLLATNQVQTPSDILSVADEDTA